MAKVIRVKLPSPTTGGAAITGRTMATVLKSLASQITAELMDKKVTNFKTDAKAREIQIHFEEESDPE